MSSLFITELPTDLAPGDTIDLAGDEAKHAVSVNRVRVGERLKVSNGAGLIADGSVESVGTNRLTLRVNTATLETEPTPRIILAQALAKGGRDELAVQTATELGVSEVIPWSAERSVSKWVGPKQAKGVERWQSIAREASKQAIRPWVPRVRSLHDAGELASYAAKMTVLILEPTAETRLSAASLATDRPILLVVGPEGGLSPAELDRFDEAGASAVRLGPEVLRTSSAGPAALAVLNIRLERW